MTAMDVSSGFPTIDITAMRRPSSSSLPRPRARDLIEPGGCHRANRSGHSRRCGHGAPGAPDVYDKDIAVKVNDGIVTLTGFVRNHLERDTAECAAKRVPGVVALANDIEVSVASHNGRSDPAIAREAVAAIRRELPLFWEKNQGSGSSGTYNARR